ncbi:MAG: hypothetical protein ABF709_04925 [Leuconostoc pseudomesenteroides]|uniref:hypothetical protein n=1 Tax=Leuconostoc pseudomesenteroides TaxID=33968 RepID=UPI001E4BC5FC|nr:hypothetical protein [Leuconostoc pseudomesenteroides]MCC7668939.1 hypothetical protein [Leuconostoc pseudomesenteroides]
MARLNKFVELYRYNTLLEFGFAGEKVGEDGVSRDIFIPTFKAYGAPYTLKYHENIANTGPVAVEKLVFAIREVGKVEYNMLAMLNGEQYVVNEMTPTNDPLNARQYDLIQLLRGNGVENTYRLPG